MMGVRRSSVSLVKFVGGDDDGEGEEGKGERSNE
jgi:hypothetical protein